jgi:hypothetical protein
MNTIISKEIIQILKKLLLSIRLLIIYGENIYIYQKKNGDTLMVNIK